MNAKKKTLLKNVIIIPILSLVVTLSMQTIKYSDNRMIHLTSRPFYEVPEDVVLVPPPSYHEISGFPFPFSVDYTEDALRSIKSGRLEPLNTRLMFILSFAFWLVFLLATERILRSPRWVINLGISVVLAITLLSVWTRTDNLCVSGFPVPFYSNCTGVFVPKSYAVVAESLDLLFWLGISLALMAGHLLLNDMLKDDRLRRKVRFVTYPAVFSILSLVYKYSSAGWIFSIELRGFPLPYWDPKGDIYWVGNVIFFLVTFAFWLVVYLAGSRIAKKGIGILISEAQDE